MNNEKRNGILGMSWANVITLILIAGSGLVAWGATTNQVSTNTEDIVEVKTEFRQELSKAKEELMEEIRAAENRTREDIRELSRYIRNK